MCSGLPGFDDGIHAFAAARHTDSDESRFAQTGFDFRVSASKININYTPYDS